MAYKIPTDLPQVPVTSIDRWPVEDRIKAAMTLEPAPVWAKLAAVAVSLNEQPGRIYVGNCCGIMCQALTEPWGFRHKHFEGCRPIGYALLREGQTHVMAPFLAFAHVEDSLTFLLRRCQSATMPVYNGRTYAVNWVGINDVTSAGAKSAVAAYERTYDKAVGALWDLATKRVPGWRDAGATGWPE